MRLIVLIWLLFLFIMGGLAFVCLLGFACLVVCLNGIQIALDLHCVCC